jgi:hypothetical protein
VLADGDAQEVEKIAAPRGELLTAHRDASQEENEGFPVISTSSEMHKFIAVLPNCVE